MFIDGLLKIDARPKFLGWAPGDYLGQCNKCGNQYIGDKRAVTCADCAYKQLPEGYALVPIDQAQNGKRYEFIRGKFGYGDWGVYLPCGVVTDADRIRIASEADEAIDKSMIAAAQEEV